MDIVLVTAKLLGIYMIISGFFLIFRGKTLPHLLQDFFGHPAIVYLTGTILIFLSTIMLFQNNIWDGTWRMIITILSWAILLKGMLYIFFPETLHKMVSRKFLETINVYGIVAIVAGLALFCIG
jgi:hypothetical protein